ncbi:hypothetical protein TNCV_4890521 [Trichonephila clavipes]|nr:hypothetical protein TNCV_4890521 [Trichonephila clavipes]
MFLTGHPSQGCFGLQSHCAPCYFFNQASFYPSDFSFRFHFATTVLGNTVVWIWNLYHLSSKIRLRYRFDDYTTFSTDFSTPFSVDTLTRYPVGRLSKLFRTPACFWNVLVNLGCQNGSANQLGLYRRESRLYEEIGWCEEAHFWLNGYVNKQNCRIWSEANPQVYVKTPLHPEKVTVWCALWAGGILLQKR